MQVTHAKLLPCHSVLVEWEYLVGTAPKPHKHSKMFFPHNFCSANIIHFFRAQQITQMLNLGICYFRVILLKNSRKNGCSKSKFYKKNHLQSFARIKKEKSEKFNSLQSTYCILVLCVFPLPFLSLDSTVFGTPYLPLYINQYSYNHSIAVVKFRTCFWCVGKSHPPPLPPSTRVITQLVDLSTQFAVMVILLSNETNDRQRKVMNPAVADQITNPLTR